MSQKQVDDHNHWMVAFSVVFLNSASKFTTWLGSFGFIIANCINMAVRIMKRQVSIFLQAIRPQMPLSLCAKHLSYSLIFINTFFRSRGHQVNAFTLYLPSASIMSALIAALAVTKASEVRHLYIAN